MAVVQARMSSSRLPGKSLAQIAGRPSLALLLARLRRAETLDRIVVATSEGADDDPVAAVAAGAGAEVVRGPLDDVLARFVLAAEGHDGPVVRITADCPLADPALVDAVAGALAAAPSAAYASNVEPRSFPKGLDVEALNAAALRELDAEVTDPELREHVTLAVRRDPERWPRVAITSGRDDLADLRWTVDTAEDLERVRALAEAAGERVEEAGWEELLELAPG